MWFFKFLNSKIRNKIFGLVNSCLQKFVTKVMKGFFLFKSYHKLSFLHFRDHSELFIITLINLFSTEFVLKSHFSLDWHQ